MRARCPPATPNGPADALRRIETMVLMGDVGLSPGPRRDQLASSLDLIVQVARRPGGSRRGGRGGR
ncbi:MAG: hypothetical protein ACRD0N_03170, partial [Acidimicrobiales bacterium]